VFQYGINTYMRIAEILSEARVAPTGITPLQAITDILGADKITTDAKSTDTNKLIIHDQTPGRVDYEKRKGGKMQLPSDMLDQANRGFITYYFSEEFRNALYASFEPPYTYGNGRVSPGKISLPSITSDNAAYLAAAVHEAYHAYIFFKTRGQGNLKSNEKIVNVLAEKWLRKHLKGFTLHSALNIINTSRIEARRNDRWEVSTHDQT